MAFDGQLWSTLGGSVSFPPALLSRISQSAGPFIHTLQLEGAASLTADDLVGIIANIAVPHSQVDKPYDAGNAAPSNDGQTKWTHSDSSSSASASFAASIHPRSLSLPFTVPIDHWTTNVTSINLSGAYSLTTRALHRLLASCPLLQKVSLRGLAAATNTTCIVLGESCKELEVLDLSRCTGVDAFGITFICEAVENRWKETLARMTGPDSLVGSEGDASRVPRRKSKLRELRISGLKRASLATVGQIASAFPDLEVLDLSYALSLTDEAWAEFVEWREDSDDSSLGFSFPRQPMGLPHVELTARQIGLDPIDRTIYRRRVTKLRHLNLSSCTSLTDQTCSYLAYAVPKLELLELGGIGAGMRDPGLIRLLETTPLIRKLDLSDASSITDAVLAALTPPPPAPEAGPRRLLTLPLPPLPSSPINIPGRPLLAPTRSASFPIPSSHRAVMLALPPPPKTGQSLEHLAVSYATALTPEAFTALIKGCSKLITLEADNTSIDNAVVREYVELQRTRLAERSKSNNTTPNVQTKKAATLVAIDCAAVGRPIIDELASKGHTRPRAGYRSWTAHLWALPYADARDGDDLSPSQLWHGGGLDECDETKVVVKSFRSWQIVDKWQVERAKRMKTKKSLGGGSSGGGASNAGGGIGGMDSAPGTPGSRGSRWFVRRSSSGATTPRSMDEDDRGCTVM